jgi:hypothetical protein
VPVSPSKSKTNAHGARWIQKSAAGAGMLTMMHASGALEAVAET